MHYTKTETGQWLLTDVQGLDQTIMLPSVGFSLSLATVYEGVFPN